MILSTPDLSPTTSFRCPFLYFLLVILQKFNPGRFTAGSPPLASIDEEVVLSGFIITDGSYCSLFIVGK